MFPRARTLMGREELERLGGELIKAKQAGQMAIDVPGSPARRSFTR